MTFSTEVRTSLGLSLGVDPISRRQGEGKPLVPVLQQVGTTTSALTIGSSEPTAVPRSTPRQRQYVAPSARASLAREVWSDSTPLQVWEGTVLEVDEEAKVMRVALERSLSRCLGIPQKSNSNLFHPRIATSCVPAPCSICSSISGLCPVLRMSKTCVSAVVLRGLPRRSSRSKKTPLRSCQ